ncbi:sentrin-specific protease [Purpureocillium lavendulum]|uniref:Sentrin-specific protease n=1 Tax=Purpureocillium lavendulum TaxID=1247861 RepID=A0AB34FIV0_9HYPO|nr:sentrin-specific protease [Purpureocillium lavendulum]
MAEPSSSHAANGSDPEASESAPETRIALSLLHLQRQVAGEQIHTSDSNTAQSQEVNSPGAPASENCAMSGSPGPLQFQFLGGASVSSDESSRGSDTTENGDAAIGGSAEERSATLPLNDDAASESPMEDQSATPSLNGETSESGSDGQNAVDDGIEERTATPTPNDEGSEAGSDNQGVMDDDIEDPTITPDANDETSEASLDNQSAMNDDIEHQSTTSSLNDEVPEAAPGDDSAMDDDIEDRSTTPSPDDEASEAGSEDQRAMDDDIEDRNSPDSQETMDEVNSQATCESSQTIRLDTPTSETPSISTSAPSSPMIKIEESSANGVLTESSLNRLGRSKKRHRGKDHEDEAAKRRRKRNKKNQRRNRHGLTINTNARQQSRSNAPAATQRREATTIANGLPTPPSARVAGGAHGGAPDASDPNPDWEIPSDGNARRVHEPFIPNPDDDEKHDADASREQNLRVAWLKSQGIEAKSCAKQAVKSTLARQREAEERAAEEARLQAERDREEAERLEVLFRSSLMRLPVDIRLQIWRLLFIADKPILVYRNWTMTYRRNVDVRNSGRYAGRRTVRRAAADQACGLPALGVLRTCKAFRDEAIPVLYGENTFCYRLRDCKLQLADLDAINTMGDAGADLVPDPHAYNGDGDSDYEEGEPAGGSNSRRMRRQQQQQQQARRGQQAEKPHIYVREYYSHFRRLAIEAEPNRFSESTKRAMAQAINVFAPRGNGVDTVRPHLKSLVLRVTPLKMVPDDHDEDEDADGGAGNDEDDENRSDSEGGGQGGGSAFDDGPRYTFVDFFQPGSPVMEAVENLRCDLFRLHLMCMYRDGSNVKVGFTFTIDRALEMVLRSVREGAKRRQALRAAREQRDQQQNQHRPQQRRQHQHRRRQQQQQPLLPRDYWPRDTPMQMVRRARVRHSWRMMKELGARVAYVCREHVRGTTDGEWGFLESLTGLDGANAGV